MPGIRNLILEGGERLPILIGDDGLPDPHITHYVVASLRSSSPKAATIQKTLQSLLVFRLWADQRGIDLVDRARSFALLTNGEMLDLKEFLRRPLRRQRALSYGNVAEINEKRLVGRKTARSRYDVAMAYLKWLGEEYLARLGDTASDRYLAASKRLERFGEMAHGMRKFGEGGRGPTTRLGLLPEQRDLLLEVIQPGHPENPFQSVHQHRNYALILLYYEFGLRLSEPLTLRLVATSKMQPSIDLTGSYSRERGAPDHAPSIWIVPNHDDPDDPRLNQPVIKTLGRLLIFHKDGLAYEAVKEWVNRHRIDDARYPGARRSPFLFVSRGFDVNAKGRRVGRPLSKKQVTKIFEALQNRHPALEGVTSHVLRHDWNDRWNEMLVERNLRWEDHLRDQIYAMGWSKHSTMPQIYGQRSIQQQANEKSLLMQEKMRSARKSRETGTS